MAVTTSRVLGKYSLEALDQYWITLGKKTVLMVFFQWVEGHKLVLHSTHFWNVRVGLRRRGSSLSWKILLVSSGTAAPLRGVKKTHFKIVFCDCLQGKRGHNFLHHRHNLHLAYVWRRCGLTGWIEISKRGFFGGMTSSDLEFNLSHSSCYPECAIQGAQLPPCQFTVQNICFPHPHTGLAHPD